MSLYMVSNSDDRILNCFIYMMVVTEDNSYKIRLDW